jgi:hypothetical protein
LNTITATLDAALAKTVFMVSGCMVNLQIDKMDEIPGIKYQYGKPTIFRNKPHL